MPVSAVDVIPRAFERMKQQLSNPVRKGQWFRLALVGFLAGEMGQNGGCSARLPLDVLSELPNRNEFQSAGILDNGVLFVLAFAIILFLAFALFFVLIYINSRMRFVLFDSVVEGECRIREFWARRSEPAYRYFLFQLLVGFGALVSAAILIGIPLLLALGLGWFDSPSQHVLGFVLGGAVVVLVFTAWVIALTVLQVLTKDFVVPQMALENRTVTQGWSRLWEMMKAEKGGYAGYIGMKILLAIAAAILLGIIGLVIVLIILIPIAVIAALVVVGGNSAGITWNPVTIATAIVLGTLLFLALFVIVSLVSVPAVVFFPAYSIYFFADRYEPLRNRLFPPAVPPEFSNPSPQL